MQKRASIQETPGFRAQESIDAKALGAAAMRDSAVAAMVGATVVAMVCVSNSRLAVAMLILTLPCLFGAWLIAFRVTLHQFNRITSTYKVVVRSVSPFRLEMWGRIADPRSGWLAECEEFLRRTFEVRDLQRDDAAGCIVAHLGYFAYLMGGHQLQVVAPENSDQVRLQLESKKVCGVVRLRPDAVAILVYMANWMRGQPLLLSKDPGVVWRTAIASCDSWVSFPKDSGSPPMVNVAQAPSFGKTLPSWRKWSIACLAAFNLALFAYVRDLMFVDGRFVWNVNVAGMALLLCAMTALLLVLALWRTNRAWVDVVEHRREPER